MGNLVGQAIFGDAAGAVIVGADPAIGERPLFEMVWASQDIIPGTEDAIVAKLFEEGLVFTLHRDVAMHISNSIYRLVTAALHKAGVAIKDRNAELFWVMHPGGRSVLDKVESRLGLRKDKLEALRQHGNTMSSCAIIVLDEMRQRSVLRSMATPGEGLEWRLFFGFGPGLTVETILFRALPSNK